MSGDLTKYVSPPIMWDAKFACNSWPNECKNSVIGQYQVRTSSDGAPFIHMVATLESPEKFAPDKNYYLGWSYGYTSSGVSKDLKTVKERTATWGCFWRALGPGTNKRWSNEIECDGYRSSHSLYEQSRLKFPPRMNATVKGADNNYEK